MSLLHHIRHLVLALLVTGLLAAVAPAAQARVDRAATLSPKGPVFLYPSNGKSLHYGTTLLFRVQPIRGANGYLWTFLQRGTIVWQNRRFEGRLSSNIYIVTAGSRAQHLMHPGPLRVQVRARLRAGRWTATSSITVYLRAAKPSPRPPIVAPSPTPGSTVADGSASNVDDYPAGWSIPHCEADGASVDCTDARAPQYEAPQTVTTPSMSGGDGRALRLVRAGGDRYSNVMYQYRHIEQGHPDALAATHFGLDLDFQYQPPTTWNNAGGNSSIQAIEFAFTRWGINREWDFELQWSNVRDDASLPPVWSVWLVSNGNAGSWQDTGVTAELTGNEWHHLQLEGSIIAGQVHYDGFSIDGSFHPLDFTSLPTTPESAPEVTVAAQLDGSAAHDPYDVFLDNVGLSWSTGSSSAPPLATNTPSPAPQPTQTPTPTGPQPLTFDEAAQWCQPNCATTDFSPLVESNGYVNPYGVHFASAGCPSFTIPSGIQYNGWDGASPFNGNGPATLHRVCEASFRRLSG